MTATRKHCSVNEFTIVYYSVREFTIVYYSASEFTIVYYSGSEFTTGNSVMRSCSSLGSRLSMLSICVILVCFIWKLTAIDCQYTYKFSWYTIHVQCQCHTFWGLASIGVNIYTIHVHTFWKLASIGVSIYTIHVHTYQSHSRKHSSLFLCSRVTHWMSVETLKS